MADYHSEVILAGRRINDGMGSHVATQVVKQLIRQGANVRDSVVTVLGFAFKENVPDLRNTRVIDIVRELDGYGLAVQVHDPVVQADEAEHEYGVSLLERADLRAAHCLVLAVPHASLVDRGWDGLVDLLVEGESSVIDIKGVLDRTSVPSGVVLWRP
jgi:UDP-N-acetyl-D-galactosamine dehydrogenase